MLPAPVDKVTSDKYTPLPESTGVDRCRSRPGVPELAGKVTRDDVARLAGVSTATVSYVINNGPRPVARDKQKSVQEAIRKLGYEPDGVARSLVTKRTRTIGFIVPDILNPAHTAITRALGDALWGADYSLTLGNSDEDPQRELAYLRAFRGKGVDGVALTPGGGNPGALFALHEAGRPLVLLDRQIEGLPADCVLFENREGTRAAVDHLIELGHRRIGLINLPAALTPGRERRDGYLDALAAAGIRSDPALIREGGFKGGGDCPGRRSEGRLLAADLLGLADPPTALFVSNNRLMRGVLHLLRERGLRVPADLALATFDDMDYYEDITPSITAVGTSLQEFGQQVARLLLDQIERGQNGRAPRVVRVPHRLNIRESTRGA